MAKKPSKSAPKKRGRPSVGAAVFLVRLRPTELGRLDAARKAHGGDLTRPEAIRRVMERLPVNALV